MDKTDKNNISNKANITLPLSTSKVLLKMYPSLRNGVMNSIAAWIEIYHQTLKELKGRLNKDDLILLAAASDNREYDAVAMIDHDYFKDNFDNLRRYTDIQEDNNTLDKLISLTAAQRLVLADWCSQYNRGNDDCKKKLIGQMVNEHEA